MSMANMEVRQAIEKKRLKHYEVAKAAGITASTLSVWLRFEMEPERKKKILKAINSIK